jgi:hypothetical protein
LQQTSSAARAGGDWRIFQFAGQAREVFAWLLAFLF